MKAICWENFWRRKRAAAHYHSYPGLYHCVAEESPVNPRLCASCPNLEMVPSRIAWLIWFLIGFQCAALATCILFALLASKGGTP